VSGTLAWPNALCLNESITKLLFAVRYAFIRAAKLSKKRYVNNGFRCLGQPTATEMYNSLFSRLEVPLADIHVGEEPDNKGPYLQQSFIARGRPCALLKHCI
jgi:hypothetical protein